jgi:hypothetical protein
MKIYYSLLFITVIQFTVNAQSNALVLQSDFGLKDGAVAAMKGVAFGVSSDLKIFDLTHEIPAYNIWEASYRLSQTAQYWPKGTVFVSVVDPGVGSDRKSIVLKTKSGHFFVTPDNGTLTLVAESLGIEQVHIIDESKNRLKNSYDSYTFHGRDVYAYTGARLAAGVITMEEVGEILHEDVVRLSYQKAKLTDQTIVGTIDALDVQYGNVWTNVGKDILEKLKINYGEEVDIKIMYGGVVKFEGAVVFGKTFSDVNVGEPVAYLNSLLNFSVGINMGDFAKQYQIGSGSGWAISIHK